MTLTFLLDCNVPPQSLHGRQDERVLHELREWQNNFINVQQYMDNLAVARGRARNLKEEVSITMEMTSSPPLRQLYDGNFHILDCTISQVLY